MKIIPQLPLDGALGHCSLNCSGESHDLFLRVDVGDGIIVPIRIGQTKSFSQHGNKNLDVMDCNRVSMIAPSSLISVTRHL